MVGCRDRTGGSGGLKGQDGWGWWAVGTGRVGVVRPQDRTDGDGVETYVAG